MADLEGLVESTFDRDFQRMAALSRCSFHKPIKLRPVRSQEHFDEMEETNFCGLPYAFRSREKEFRFDGMDYIARTRFIELLASLTLYHFSRSSKASYIECLDTRGLEFSAMSPRGGRISLSGFEGKLRGFPKKESFAKYSVGYGRLYAHPGNFKEYPADIAVKKYKMLDLTFHRETFDNLISDFCATFMNEGVEHVRLKLNSMNAQTADPQVEKNISLAKLGEFFNYCRGLKTLGFVDMEQSGFVTAGFAAIQRMIENWSTKTLRMEVFIFIYRRHFFQIHKNQLKRCVKKRAKWFWSGKCDIDEVDYEIHCRDRFGIRDDDALPHHLGTSHHDDILGIPDKELFQNCVRETLKIPNTLVGLIIGKRGGTFRSIQTTFNVKLLLFQPDYIQGIGTGQVTFKYLKIGGIPANVARAKEHILSIIDRPAS